MDFLLISINKTHGTSNVKWLLLLPIHFNRVQNQMRNVILLSEVTLHEHKRIFASYYYIDMYDPRLSPLLTSQAL